MTQHAFRVVHEELLDNQTSTFKAAFDSLWCPLNHQTTHVVNGHSMWHQWPFVLFFFSFSFLIFMFDHINLKISILICFFLLIWSMFSWLFFYMNFFVKLDFLLHPLIFSYVIFFPYSLDCYLLYLISFLKFIFYDFIFFWFFPIRFDFYSFYCYFFFEKLFKLIFFSVHLLVLNWLRIEIFDWV